jgi:hypothetical protein
MKENGLRILRLDRARGFRYGLTDQCTKVGGKIIKQMVKED